MNLFSRRTLFIGVTLFSVMSSSKRMFPDTLKGFGYAFNKDGQLRKIVPETGEPGTEAFDFNVSDDPSFNQMNYDALGEVVTEYVYGLLENELGLKKLMVPKNGPESESTFVFATPDIYKNTERLLILIHGAGVVRAGQWARSLIINDSLKSGTQIPYIKRARELGYEVLVLNTNDNSRIVDGTRVEIKGSKSPEQHASYVWDNYVKEINPEKIAIVAHSYGGCVTRHLAHKYFSDFHSKVFAIALTDSVHNVRSQKLSSKINQYLQKVGCNWAADDSPLDTPLETMQNDIPRVSAGHTKHEMTSWSCFGSVFKFIEEQYKNLTDMPNNGGSTNFWGRCNIT